MFFKKYWLIITIIVTIVISLGITMIVICTPKKNNTEELYDSALDLQEYREYLLTLSAEDVIAEHFKNKNENNVPKILETVVDFPDNADWDQSNIKYIEITDISFIEHATTIFIDYLDSKDEEFLEAKVFDVTYEVEYKRIITQGNGQFKWKYNMIKKTKESPWLIESFGF